ncbi:GspMb/PilO family protein [Sphingomonas koreensis]
MNRATLIAGIGGGLVAVALLAPATGTALGKLARARGAVAEARTAVRAPARAPVPLTAAGLRAPGGNEAAAAGALAARVRKLAAEGGVLVEQAARVPAGEGVAKLQLRLSGPDKAVVALVDRIEREAPLLRFAAWRATALPGGSVRIEGEAVAAWR